jgi:hypothetical protein
MEAQVLRPERDPDMPRQASAACAPGSSSAVSKTLPRCSSSQATPRRPAKRPGGKGASLTSTRARSPVCREFLVQAPRTTCPVPGRRRVVAGARSGSGIAGMVGPGIAGKAVAIRRHFKQPGQERLVSWDGPRRPAVGGARRPRSPVAAPTAPFPFPVPLRRPGTTDRLRRDPRQRPDQLGSATSWPRSSSNAQRFPVFECTPPSGSLTTSPIASGRTRSRFGNSSIRTPRAAVPRPARPPGASVAARDTAPALPPLLLSGAADTIE